MVWIRLSHIMPSLFYLKTKTMQLTQIINKKFNKNTSKSKFK